MKDNKKIIVGVSIFIVVIVAAVIIAAFSLIKPKEAITADEFVQYMEENGLVISDVLDQFGEVDYINNAYIAIARDYSYQIEFYELQDDEYAEAFYENNAEKIYKTRTDNSTQYKVSGPNYDKLSLTKTGKYKVVSRIGNTAIYIDVDEAYKDTVKDLLDGINY